MTRHVLSLVKSCMSGWNPNANLHGSTPSTYNPVLKHTGMKFCILGCIQHAKITFQQNHIVETPTMARYAHSTMKTWSFSLVLCSYIPTTSHLLCCHHSLVGCCMVSGSNSLWKLLESISVNGNGSNTLLALSLAP